MDYLCNHEQNNDSCHTCIQLFYTPRPPLDSTPISLSLSRSKLPENTSHGGSASQANRSPLFRKKKSKSRVRFGSNNRSCDEIDSLLVNDGPSKKIHDPNEAIRPSRADRHAKLVARNTHTPPQGSAHIFPFSKLARGFGLTARVLCLLVSRRTTPPGPCSWWAHQPPRHQRRAGADRSTKQHQWRSHLHVHRSLAPVVDDVLNAYGVVVVHLHHPSISSLFVDAWPLPLGNHNQLVYRECRDHRMQGGRYRDAEIAVDQLLARTTSRGHRSGELEVGYLHGGAGAFVSQIRSSFSNRTWPTW